jgi:hypothetical protein
MEIESDLKLLKYTDTEVLMDDFSMSMTDFMSRFEKFKVDEVSIEDAQSKTLKTTYVSMQKTFSMSSVL